MLDPHDYIPWPYGETDEDDAPLLDDEPLLDDPSRENVDEVDRSMRTPPPNQSAKLAQQRRKRTGKV